MPFNTLPTILLIALQKGASDRIFLTFIHLYTQIRVDLDRARWLAFLGANLLFRQKKLIHFILSLETEWQKQPPVCLMLFQKNESKAPRTAASPNLKI